MLFGVHGGRSIGTAGLWRVRVQPIELVALVEWLRTEERVTPANVAPLRRSTKTICDKPRIEGVLQETLAAAPRHLRYLQLSWLAPFDCPVADVLVFDQPATVNCSHPQVESVSDSPTRLDGT